MQSEEYQKLLDLNSRLQYKTIKMSVKEQEDEIKQATREIDEDIIDNCRKYNGDEEKYIEILKKYVGYRNEWKLYTRKNVNCFNYYFHKAKFILENYYLDYQYFYNFLYRNNEKYLDENLKKHFEIVKNNKRLKQMSQEEFEFRLEYVRLLDSAYTIPELSEFTQLISFSSFYNVSERNLAEMYKINIGSVKNDIKKMRTALARVLQDRDKKFIKGSAYLKLKERAEEKLELKNKLIRVGELIQELEETNNQLKKELKKKK